MCVIEWSVIQYKPTANVPTWKINFTEKKEGENEKTKKQKKIERE